jgi:chromosome segregation ATPase
MLKKVWQNKALRYFLLLVIIAGLFLYQCNQIANLERELATTEVKAERLLNNYKAANDSIKRLKLDNGYLVSSIRSYEFEVNSLESRQERLISKYQKALDLNRDLKEVTTLLSTKIEIKDSLLANISITRVDSTTDLLKFSKLDDFGNGNTRYLEGSMYAYNDDNSITYKDPTFTIEQELTLFAGIEKVDGYKEVKISTQYPGLTIKDIENINLINNELNQRTEKEAGWSIGAGLGYGINLNNNQVISYGPTIGIGVFWSPKWLRF